MQTAFWITLKPQDWSCHELHFISTNKGAFFAIQIRAIISTQAVIVLGRMIAHILFKKKKNEKERKEKRRDHSRILQCSVPFYLCVCSFFKIQPLSSNLLSHYVHILLNSRSLYLSCLQLKYSQSFYCTETLKMPQTKLDII